MKTRLGRQETLLLSYAQMRKWRTIRSGDLLEPLNLSVIQERKLLCRLSQAQMIARVWRGVYLVPPRLPMGGKWSPGEFLALDALMETLGGTYQICGPNAFNRYGYDEQVPARVYVYNNRIFGERRIGPVTLMLIKVADERLGNTDTFVTPDGVTAIYSSRVRTLLDAVYDWSRFNTLPRAYDWIRQDLTARRVTPSELVDVTLKYGDIGTIRRMGVLLERQGVPARVLLKLERPLRPSTSRIPWIPRLPKRGRVNRRWGVVENDQSSGAAC